MKAIETTVTNVTASARCIAGSLSMHVDRELTTEQNHAVAAEAACREHGWDGELVGGVLVGDDDVDRMAWVFIDGSSRCNEV